MRKVLFGVGVAFVVVLVVGVVYHRATTAELARQVHNLKLYAEGLEDSVAYKDSRVRVLRDSVARLDSASADRVRAARERASVASRRAERLTGDLRDALDAARRTDLLPLLDSLGAGHRAALEAKDEEIAELRQRLYARDNLIAAQDSTIRKRDALLEAKDALIAKLEEQARGGLRLPFGVRLPGWAGYAAAGTAGLLIGVGL